MNTIKMLIWDLDDSFWKGTLSDGCICPIESNISLVKTLTNRGIVNSICSKNDFEAARQELEEEGVWNYFVFPSIDWTPKGERVRRIIEDARLRPANVLFVDDNKLNLEEALFVQPELNVAHPDELDSLVQAEAFRGKEDLEHKRLSHYQILEKQRAEREEWTSNEDFLFQSDIHVEMVEDCHDQLERIHEMIHRNNQLNYTKDRISQEEVEALFCDTDVRSGYVKVSDKYGDHGIVGCYAVKEGELAQLVFSCRVLGMGVEQWVYAQLGSPRLTVVGDVAVSLEAGVSPAWINQEAASVQQSEMESTQSRLLAYGSCSLRSVWAYLKPKLPRAVFSDAPISRRLSFFNLGVAARLEESITDEWLEKVKFFDSKYTFCRDAFSPEIDYLLISLDLEMDTLRYVSKTDENLVFYSAEILTEADAARDILSSYTVTRVTDFDLRTELSCIAENLAPNAKLLIQTLPETVFPSQGKDEDWQRSIAANRVAEHVADCYDNVELIDIRKYATKPSDFFDAARGHFNRAIGYWLAKEVLDIVLGDESTGKVRLAKSDPTCHPDPANALRDTAVIEGIGEVTLVSFIRNGKLYARVECVGEEKLETSFSFMCGRMKEYRTPFSLDTSADFALRISGTWHVEACLRLPDGREDVLVGDALEYSQFDVPLYLDPSCSDLEGALGEFIEMSRDNKRAAQTTNDVLIRLGELVALEANPAEYFLDKGVHSISLFTDKTIGSTLVPILAASKLKLDAIYTADSVDHFDTLPDLTRIKVSSIDELSEAKESRHVLMAFDYNRRQMFWKRFEEKGYKLHYVMHVLDSVKTRHVLEDLVPSSCPRILAVRGGVANYPYGMPVKYLRPGEASLHTQPWKLGIDLRLQDEGKLPGNFKGIRASELAPLLQYPTFYRDSDGVQRMRDIHDDGLTIEDGFRKTVGQPENYEATIYIFGALTAFGCGVSDSETIASYLQALYGEKYRVVNCANVWGLKGYDEVLKLLKSIEYASGDIAVLIMTQYRHPRVVKREHWLEWSAVPSYFEKVDTFPLFAERNRPDYLALENVYTKECNERVAQLIYDAIEHPVPAKAKMLLARMRCGVATAPRIIYKFISRLRKT